MDYQIDRLSSQNIGLLVRLHKRVFGGMISTEFLREKYDTRAFGAEFIGYMAIDPWNQAIAYYGVIPCHFQLQGQTILAAQSADTMTHPDHRNKGLFIMLAQKTYALARDSQIKFIFGFPNQNSLPGFKKLGWNFLPDPLQMFSIKIPAIPYAKLLRRRSIFSLVYDMIWGSDSNISYETLFPETSSGVKHDATFFNYKKYYQRMMLKVKGVDLWVRVDGKFKVGAVHGLEHVNIFDFVDQIKLLAAKMGCNEIVFMTSRNSRLYSQLSTRLSSKDAFPIGYHALGNEGPEIRDVAFEYCDVDIF